MHNVSFDPTSSTRVSSSIYINIINDNVVESRENFSLTIDPSSLPTGIIFGSPSQATVNIYDFYDCKSTCIKHL